jgi:predicted nucleotidyltransferase
MTASHAAKTAQGSPAETIVSGARGATIAAGKPNATNPPVKKRGFAHPQCGILGAMRHHQAIALLRPQAATLRALGATSLYLFGSTARDTARPDSDLDVFIDYDESTSFSLIDLVRIKQTLEASLHVKIDITTRDSLDALLKPRIEATAERIF